jgi:hypothetical protein
VAGYTLGSAVPETTHLCGSLAVFYILYRWQQGRIPRLASRALYAIPLRGSFVGVATTEDAVDLDRRNRVFPEAIDRG